MSKQASSVRIGLFVVGAIALVVVAVAVFGSGALFARTRKIVMSFRGSVKGLTVGAPITFRGVRIGTVTDVSLVFRPENLQIQVPVVGEIEAKRLQLVGKLEPARDNLKALIDRGLRAQLQVQSFVTGQLVVALDFFPDQPKRLTGVDGRYLEIPTVPTPLEQLSHTLEKLPLDEVSRAILSTTQGIDRLVNSPELAASLVALRRTLEAAQVAAANLKDASGPIKTASVNVERVLSESRRLPGQLTRTLAAASEALEAAERALTAVGRLTSTRSVFMNDIGKAVDQLSEMARSLRQLSEYLELHPEALIWGKRAAKGGLR